MTGASGTGLYLHVPFCAHRCGYCDFPLVAGAPRQLQARYVAALRADLARVAAAGPRAVAPPGADVEASWPQFTSVFVGGGTPTLLPPDVLAGILRHARDVLPVAADAEVSSEANPEGLSAEGLAVLVEAGLTRLSIGAQSFAPRVLGFLDRRHEVSAPLRAVGAARAAGVQQVNLDLIYGAPAETTEDFQASLRAALSAGTDHVSAYALTLERGTPYAARVRRGEQAAPDDDVAAERMACAEAVLGAAGFERYETSNWARPGAHCRHNLTYWRGGDYLGVGAGAHGHWQGRRWWSHRGVVSYTGAALAGETTTSGAEILGEASRRAERLMLGLRLAEGVARADVEPLDEPAVRAALERGLLSDDGARLVLTPSGRPLADGVTVDLLA
jgi:oxygen-independent coproporphyrinogen-3 oxidase